MSSILVTGGAGYIGSHTAIELLQAGYDLTVVDNLVNSSSESLHRVEEITGKQLRFKEFDLRDNAKLDELFAHQHFDSVIHFAGLKAVSESVEKPLEYYGNNLDSTIVLLNSMAKYGVKDLIFSSSATVYGTPEELPLKETSRVGIGITNPYGWTKFMIEQMLCDVSSSDDNWHITSLRYFNPIGAHPSGKIGEDPKGVPNNLLPLIAQVAVGRRDKLAVFGNDYDTSDGTGVRDYIHVVDLARGHLAALQHLSTSAGFTIYNLGTGHGTSVFEAVKAFEQASGKQVPYEIKPRRSGDIAVCYADASKAQSELGWQTELTLEDACRDAWNWQSKNPSGYNVKGGVS